MWPYYPELLETPVPRYTSFPTAAEFGPAVGSQELDAALRAVSGDVSLYLHIPFCEQICWYCGCNTGAANRRDRLASYLDSLHREIALVGTRLDGRVSVRRVAFGGGSPNAIAPTDFVRLVDALTLKCDLVDPVWSIELDPRTLSDDWEPVLRVVGVQRASMGVQTFSPRLQAAIGRVQPDAMIEGSTAMLRRAGVSSINFDLMYGLPGQTMDDLQASLARSVELGADRIALFGYAHVPHIIPRQKRIDASELPDQAQRFAMAATGHDYLAAAGYVPIGFDHFALPGDPMAMAARAGQVHRNFQGFTDDAAPVLLGLGASAISMFPDVIVQNEKNAGRYRMMLSQDRVPGHVGVLRSASDRELGGIITEFLCQGRARVGRERLAAMAPALAQFTQRGLAVIEGEDLVLLQDGVPYARTIAALFDPYRQDSARRFSSAV
ncbi:MAG: coproporphyrinogen dehydrogenase [Sphingomonadales bacterium]|nr:coproporphyrinogen dehydrogenase [Sphingomonadales bacterium]